MAANNFGAVWYDLHRPDIDVHSFVVDIGIAWGIDRRKRSMDSHDRSSIRNMEFIHNSFHT